MIGIPVLFGLAAVAIYLAWTYNLLIRRRNRVKAAWAQVDVQLSRRLALIPNLVEVARGYMAHERAAFDELASLRGKALEAGANVPIRALVEARLAGALAGLLGTAEAYPALKASEVMLRLQEDLTSTEARIALARRNFDNQVRDYNVAISVFPTAVFTGLMGFQAEALFVADDADRAPVRVEL